MGTQTRDGYEDIGFARVDHDRIRRRGFPEAIFAPGKTTLQVLFIAESLLAKGATNVLVTRATGEVLDALAGRFPEAWVVPEARLCVLNPTPRPAVGRVVVAAWRPEDRPAAEEAAVTAEVMGSAVARRLDAPFRQPDRFPEWVESLDDPRVVVAADGGGGALVSVLAGLARCLVIALPTSAGSPWNGMPALLSGLNSCVPGVVAVNIDNGFGAGYAAHVINAAGELAHEAGLAPLAASGRGEMR